MRVQSYFKSFISILLSTIFVLSTVLILPPNLESKADMSSVAGELAVGSPLCSQQFALDDWNYWEMLAFGVFISNFCTPFEDDYNSAFTSGSSLGSKGRGLAAMKFATGGDAESEGYLRDMLNYCKDTQKTTYKKIFVKYHYYEYNEDVGTAAGGQRDATIGDLFPVLSISDNSANREIASINAIKRPVVYYSMLKPSKNSGGSVGETIMDMATLPEFYVDGKTALAVHAALHPLGNEAHDLSPPDQVQHPAAGSHGQHQQEEQASRNSQQSRPQRSARHVHEQRPEQHHWDGHYQGGHHVLGIALDTLGRILARRLLTRVRVAAAREVGIVKRAALQHLLQVPLVPKGNLVI